MAKDYFQDITPPAGEPTPPRQFTPRPPEASQPILEAPEVAGGARDIPIRVQGSAAEPDGPLDPASRGIRSISAPPRTRPLRVTGPNMDIREAPPLSGGMPPRLGHGSHRLWIWAAAFVAVLAAAGFLLFAFGSTTVTVTPKSRLATLSSAPLTAHLAASAGDVPTAGLSYTLQTFDLEDSEVVPVQGTTHVESKASGSITVYNAYSTTPVKLVKNTRFQSPSGLVFRAVSDVVVPGKSGSTAGHVNVTVVADQAGEKYNLDPVEKFTLPGLKSTAAMYTGVYAKSTSAFSGGLSGDQPGAAPGALEAAVSQVRTRLEGKAREAALGQQKDGTLVFPDLIRIRYESLPNTTEAGSSVRIHQKAHVEIPVFPADAFSEAIAQAAFTESDTGAVRMKPSSDFSVHALASEDGSGTLNLVASGSALIIWKVDATALATALQGKESAAFQSIVNGFSSIQEAHARISPFWKNTFPAKASDIRIDPIEPAAAK